MLKTQIRNVPLLPKAFLSSFNSPALWSFVVIGNATLVVCAFAFYHFEHDHNPQVKDWFDAVWWAFCTVTTVGYGDVTPITINGRITGIILMITGVTTFVGFTALLVSGILSYLAKSIIVNEQVTMKEYEHIIQEIHYLHRKIDSLAQKSDSKSQ